jgi:hypothetical protein
MKPIKLAITLIGCAGLITMFTGCASIICGKQQSVSIDSKPTGAEVLVYDSNGEIIFQSTTPCVANLNRRTSDYESADYVVLIRKEGFAPVQVPLTGKLNRAYLANFLNVIGFAIDPITGALWTLSPDEVSPKLEGEQAAFFGNKKGILICLKDQVPQDLVPYLRPVQN